MCQMTLFFSLGRPPRRRSCRVCFRSIGLCGSYCTASSPQRQNETCAALDWADTGCGGRLMELGVHVCGRVEHAAVRQCPPPRGTGLPPCTQREVITHTHTRLRVFTAMPVALSPVRMAVPICALGLHRPSFAPPCPPSFGPAHRSAPSAKACALAALKAVSSECRGAGTTFWQALAFAPLVAPPGTQAPRNPPLPGMPGAKPRAKRPDASGPSGPGWAALAAPTGRTGLEGRGRLQGAQCAL
jgi:hypothetical protein